MVLFYLTLKFTKATKEQQQMQKTLLLLIVVLLLLTGCKDREKNMKTMEIKDGWQFRKIGDSQWYTAAVPGCVHTDLMANGLMEDPFYRDNEEKVQWAEEEEWEYQAPFLIEKELLQKENISIIFKGLDTYARVSLNNNLLLQADNMFRQWKADVKPLLKEGENILRVHFLSPVKEALPLWKQLGYELPGGPKVITRKPGYHYGWDWGPRLVTSGIWQPVYLQAWDKAKIESLQWMQKKITKEKALLAADIEIHSTCPGPEEAVISIVHENNHKEKRLMRTVVQLVPGINRTAIEFEIEKPQLWWVNGWGEPYLYHLKGRLKVGGRLLDEVSQNIGLRTLELVNKKDKKGESFYFKLNGIPLYIKGANYIPRDSFLNRVTVDKYKALIKAAKDTHMNMLRVWGGGIYEKDIFYDLCDEAGILVWQDFMFACAMYPGMETGPGFLENVRQEAIENVTRLRHHPCIALWCGNNEIDEAWHNWGWLPSFSLQHQEQIWNNYKKLFHEILPQVVEEYDSHGFYWPSSPKFGRFDERSLNEGDSHYWGVWHDEEPFDIFKEKIPRFMSEYGFQSFPQMKTIKQFTLPEDRDLESKVMTVRQKHPRGNELIKIYMARDFHVPGNFDFFIYVNQVLQAEGMKTGIEAHRRAKPYCMGTLYWQLNDCWPAVSWSGIDYYGNWKALHYFVKKAYEEVLVSPVMENGKLKVYIVSDRLQPQEGLLDLKLVDFSGNPLWEKALPCRIPPIASRCCFETDLPELLAGKNKCALVLTAEFITESLGYARSHCYFVPPKDLELSDPDIRVEVDDVPNGFNITLSCESLAKNVYLSTDDFHGFFTDNYFDLLPHSPATVNFVTDKKAANFPQKLKIISLYDTID
jgi:beta-mannosidase